MNITFCFSLTMPLPTRQGPWTRPCTASEPPRTRPMKQGSDDILRVFHHLGLSTLVSSSTFFCSLEYLRLGDLKFVQPTVFIQFFVFFFFRSHLVFILSVAFSFVLQQPWLAIVWKVSFLIGRFIVSISYWWLYRGQNISSSVSRDCILFAFTSILTSFACLNIHINDPNFCKDSVFTGHSSVIKPSKAC